MVGEPGKVGDVDVTICVGVVGETRLVLLRTSAPDSEFCPDCDLDWASELWMLAGNSPVAPLIGLTTSVGFTASVGAVVDSSCGCVTPTPASIFAPGRGCDTCGTPS